MLPKTLPNALFGARHISSYYATLAGSSLDAKLGETALHQPCNRSSQCNRTQLVRMLCGLKAVFKPQNCRP